MARGGSQGPEVTRPHLGEGCGRRQQQQLRVHTSPWAAPGLSHCLHPLRCLPGGWGPAEPEQTNSCGGARCPGVGASSLGRGLSVAPRVPSNLPLQGRRWHWCSARLCLTEDAVTSANPQLGSPNWTEQPPPRQRVKVASGQQSASWTRAVSFPKSELDTGGHGLHPALRHSGTRITIHIQGVRGSHEVLECQFLSEKRNRSYVDTTGSPPCRRPRAPLCPSPHWSRSPP